MRPRLHRYCSRMLGSAFDGEDVVQDALAKALEAHAQAGDIRNPEGWLLAIAHNAAIDALRQRRRERIVEGDEALDSFIDPNAQADIRVVNSASLAAFLHLSVIQRCCVLMSDVLGYSLEETAQLLGVTVPSVKAALHRGRQRIRELATAPAQAAPRVVDADRDRLRRYVDRFNAGDFDALRDLLSEEVRLDLVNRLRLEGRKAVSIYFTRYSENGQCRLELGLAEGRPVLLVNDPAISERPVGYVILLEWSGEKIGAIRDFRHASYVMESLTTTPLSGY
jgi:RNA polymerase sigma-70 factor (ECF subfamily)